MIFDTLNNIDSYKNVSPLIYRGLCALRDADFSAMADGSYPIDGEKLFMSISTYDTKPVNDTPEAHRKYIDIQYIIDGAEVFGIGSLDKMTDEVESRRGGDIRFYHGPVSNVLVEAGSFVILWPQDAHAPGIAPEAPAPVRKALVKVLVEAC